MQFLQSLIMDKSNNPRILERCFSVKDSIQFRVSVRQRFYSDRSISRPRGEGGGGGRGNLPEKLGGPLPKTITLFLTKICDIPYLTPTMRNPIYDLTIASKSCFKPAL